MEAWKNYPWSNRVRWPASFLFETTDKWKLDAWPCCFLLDPVPGALPVVVRASKPIQVGTGLGEPALIEVQVYTSGHLREDIAVIPAQALLAYVDLAFTDRDFLVEPLPELRRGTQSELWAHLQELLSRRCPKSARRDAYRLDMVAHFDQDFRAEHQGRIASSGSGETSDPTQAKAEVKTDKRAKGGKARAPLPMANLFDPPSTVPSTVPSPAATAPASALPAPAPAPTPPPERPAEASPAPVVPPTSTLSSTSASGSSSSPEPRSISKTGQLSMF